MPSSTSNHLQYWIDPTKHTHRQDMAKEFFAGFFFFFFALPIQPVFFPVRKNKPQERKWLDCIWTHSHNGIKSYFLPSQAHPTAHHLSISFILNPQIFYALLPPYFCFSYYLYCQTSLS